ncbi:uncharacterized protein LOC134818930 isoform X2 [Bolinopsis microptera]|uniref:uncharacterized protein LOC134818930 isoform X2 n=1 Tax=Bolinopsis microptera TaxID=2820187 RepID=UPI00307A25B4
MMTPLYAPRIHMVPMVATREGVLVPLNIPPPPNHPAIQHHLLQSFPRPPLPPPPLCSLPPPQYPSQQHQPPVARLKPIPLSTVPDVTPASQSSYMEEPDIEELDSSLTSGTKADTKENNPPEQKTDRVQTPDVAAKQRTISGSLNPGAAEFSPPVLAPDSWPQLSRPHHHVQPTPQQIPPNRMHDALLSRATASLSSPVVGAPISVPVNVGAPIRPSQEQASYAERKNLLERISDLELILEETTNKYDKEINHMKTQLVDQLDEHSKLKSKAKQYKQEAKNAQDIVQDFTKLQIDHERILKQMEDERKNWLSERTGKSVESKKLIVTMKIEIEEANKRNRELDTRSVALSKENALLKAKLQQIENELFSRDQATMNLRGDVLDLNEKYKGTQQKHVMERYNTAQLRLRIAYANCEAQIRERAKLENPEFYYLSLWLECQDNIKIRIDDNNHLYKEYVTSLHNSQDMEVKFEQEPPCPAIETAVPMLPLQRFDDILLGRPAPPLPSAPSNYHQNDSELKVLADLMRDTNMASFMAPPDTSQIPHFPNSSHLVPSTPAHLVASTPAIPSSNTHFQFSDLDMPPTNSSTRPPSSGGSSNTSRPPSKPLDLADFMKQQSRQPAAHFQIADTLSPVVSETRQPADNVPDFAIPSSVIPNLSGSNRSSPAAAAITQPTEPSRPPVRGRGRARTQRSGQSTVPPVVGSNQPVGSVSPRQVEQPTQPKVPGPPATRAPGARSGPERGAALKNRIKEKFSFLSEKEINKYLKRVKEDTDAQGIKVTPTIALLRVSELVELDYPSTPLNTSVPVVPEKTCVICHEGLNLMAVSRLGCGHDFHKKCVDQWFATQNHTCPTCRSHEPPVDMFPPLTR